MPQPVACASALDTWQVVAPQFVEQATLDSCVVLFAAQVAINLANDLTSMV